MTSKLIPYKSHIDHIIHISDIHIQLYKRHDEYSSIFNKLYTEIKQHKQNFNIDGNRDIPLIIVITGDILHSKSDLSPECIHITYNFFKNLATLCPTFFIAGNHDLNLNNRERLDSLTPIMADLDTIYPIYYLKNTGLYRVNNIVFSVSSVFDYDIIPSHEISHSNDITKIMLYHGRVDGVELFNGYRLDGIINAQTSTRKTITPAVFNGYDLVLCGDIHKHQFFTPNMGYAGSLIQQNHGEPIDGHGYILWTISNKSGSFKHITNDWAYQTIRIRNAELLDTLHQCQYLRLRILYQNTPKTRLDELIGQIKTRIKVLEISYQEDLDLSSVTTNGLDKTQPKFDHIKITSVENQNREIEKFLDQYHLEPTEIIAIKELNTLANTELEAQPENKYITTDNVFSLVSLEFSNLFSYGEGNRVQFLDMNGIVGIIADNHMGKSALLDIITYCIYDKMTRKGNIKDIINNRKMKFYIRLIIHKNNWEYLIVKQGLRAASGTTTVKVEFKRALISSGGVNGLGATVENLEEDTSTKTKHAIGQHFGSFEDLINTNFSIQNNNCAFIDAENTSRKHELERILKFDFLGELLKKANSIYMSKKNILDHLDKKLDPETLIKYGKSLEEYVSITKNIETTRDDIQKRLETENKHLNHLHCGLDMDLDSIITQIHHEYKCKTTLEFTEAIKVANDKKIQQQRILTDYQTKLDSGDSEQYTQQLDKIIENISEFQTKIMDITTSKVGLVFKGQPHLLETEIKKCLAELESLEQTTETTNIILPDYLAEYERLNAIGENGLIDNIKQYFKESKSVQRIYSVPSPIADYHKWYFIRNNMEFVIDGVKMYLENKTTTNTQTNAAHFQRIGKLRAQLESLESDKLNSDANKVKDAEIAGLKMNIKALENEKQQIKQRMQMLGEMKRVETVIESLEIQIGKLKTGYTRLEELQDRLAESAKIKDAIEIQKRKIKEIEKEHKEITDKFNIAQANIIKYHTLIAQFKKDNEEKYALEKETKRYDLYRMALKQLPFIFMASIGPILEKKINDLLVLVADFTLKFEITEAKIDVYLDRRIYNGRMIVVNNASGFERFISSLAIRLALLEVSSLPRMNFMAIDEGWSSFDNHNSANINIILEYLKTKFKFIINISHLTNIKEYCDMQIYLRRDEYGFSCIKQIDAPT